MFFRTKTIKATPLVQLVEAYRNAEGQPRQRVVASLGDANIPETDKNPLRGLTPFGRPDNGFQQ